jgi:hypothetical protein
MTPAEQSVLTELQRATGTSISLPFRDLRRFKVSLTVNSRLYRMTEQEFLDWSIFSSLTELRAGLQEPSDWGQLARAALRHIRIM